MHEIVTLQFGQQSNYLGTHFWNTQESYFTYDSQTESPVDHDVHFRPGIGADGSDTFMPRAVIYDLKGAFGSLKKINALYDPLEEAETSAGLWQGTTVPIRAEPIAPSTYTQHMDAGLEPPQLTPESVRYWSDYSRVYFHPKGLVQLHEYELQSRIMPFEAWDAGGELFGELDKEHDLLDRDLRPFIEECDQLQALQMMTGVDDAWGGFSSRYAERLRDEFGKLSIWVWALEDEEKKARDKKLLALTNRARSLSALTEQATAYIPLLDQPSKTPSYLTYSPSSRWHTSALQAAALESMTLPSRLKPASQRHTFAEMEAAFNNGGNRRIAELSMSVADPEALTARLREEEEAAEKAREAKMGKPGAGKPPRPSRAYEGLDEEDDENQGARALDVEFLGIGPEQVQRGMGGRKKRVHVFGRVDSLRGDWEQAEKIEEQNAKARDRFAGSKMVQRYTTPLLFPHLDSYPPIFRLNSTAATTTRALAVQASLATSTGITERVRGMAALVGRTVALDEREALSNALQTLREEYEEGWDSELDDSGEDDE
ncbi:uncharacterized protein K452DRAFT_269038 [Aplosporella prunicola CBS 121167]|uniref:Tubulin nucleotide-binding domain-like protein n=1 Tax=Aplosporella prunicola CBS 121167 TaxID=1176127 RepID=A0A6A6BLQ8_9PEZI|nr:uncharacterized protein K452DRAFT_269038 [Aplosporella prunicola CBS 121167]KAF2143481.1 hypothetical protein K452DRAFT_269038 [Aplosporella prunicola CBS 121167]